MDHAHLLQRPGRNLPRLPRRSFPDPRSPPPTSPLHRPPVPPPRRNHHTNLHRRLPLLRSKSLAGFSQHRAPHLTWSAAVLPPLLRLSPAPISDVAARRSVGQPLAAVRSP